MWVLGAIQAGLGIYQLIRGGIEQNKFNKMKQPTYGLTSSMKSAKAQAEQVAQMGYTPQERAAFEQRLATSGNTAFRRATDMSGGNMAQALQGALNAQNIAAQNQFAAQDAALRRQNIAARNQIYGMEQNLENQNVRTQQELMKARAKSLGEQRQSGLSNLFGSLGGFMGLFGGNSVNPTEKLKGMGHFDTLNNAEGMLDKAGQGGFSKNLLLSNGNLPMPGSKYGNAKGFNFLNNNLINMMPSANQQNDSQYIPSYQTNPYLDKGFRNENYLQSLFED